MCALKRKSSTAHFAVKLTAETQVSSAKNHHGQTAGAIRTGGTPAERSAFIPFAEVWDDSFQARGVRRLRNSEPYAHRSTEIMGPSAAAGRRSAERSFLLVFFRLSGGL